MGAFYETIPDSLMEWILAQKMFWVASAPWKGGHVNVSPKGGPYFGLLSNKQFWYMDLTGSGSETISHLHEPHNGRITILFNAFEGPPRIVRLWGRGTVYETGTRAFDTFVAEHKVQTIPGTRTIIVVDIHQVGSSCGFSVPYYDFKEHRPILNDHFKKKEERFLAGKEAESMPRYWAFKNAYSMDGLPAMKLGLKSGKVLSVKPIKKMVGPLAPRNQDFYGSSAGFGWVHLLFVLMLGLVFGYVFAIEGGLVREKLQEVLVPVFREAKTRIEGVAVAIPSPAQILKR